MKIGLLSDTHGWLDSKILDFFKDCDEVWHCGDIGDLAVTDRLAANFNLRAVYGNIDGGEIRTMFAPTLIFDSLQCHQFRENQFQQSAAVQINKAL